MFRLQAYGHKDGNVLLTPPAYWAPGHGGRLREVWAVLKRSFPSSCCMEVQMFYSLMDNRHWGNPGQGGFIGAGGETLEWLPST